MRFIRFLVLTICALLAQALSCDPDHHKKCEWYLMPDVDRIGKAEEGFIPVCARNFVVNKQDCRLQSTLEFAQANYNKKFRYVDLKVKSTGIPRTIESIQFCQE